MKLSPYMLIPPPFAAQVSMRHAEVFYGEKMGGNLFRIRIGFQQEIAILLNHKLSPYSS